jgi:N utilization substance protein B
MRRQARELALQILFQIEFTDRVSDSELLELFEPSTSKDVIDYANVLISGVKASRDLLDEQIQATSSHWKLDRMSLVDRNILRLALFEMKFAEEKIKPAVAINEAVEIAKKYGTTESASFVNGLLDTLQRKL